MIAHVLSPSPPPLPCPTMCNQLDLTELPTTLTSATLPTGHAVTNLDVAHLRLGADVISYILRQCSPNLHTLRIGDVRGELQASIYLPKLLHLDAPWWDVSPHGRISPAMAALVQRCDTLLTARLGSFVPVASPTLQYVWVLSVCVIQVLCVAMAVFCT
jgi:hypothetical protein